MNIQNLYNKALDKLVDKPSLEARFFKLLSKKFKEAVQMLVERFDYQCSQSPKSAKFMYENNTMYGYKPEEGIRSALKHGTIVVGHIGIAETLNLLIGKDQTTEEGLALAKKIEKFLNEKCAEAKQKLKLNIGNYLTPQKTQWAA